MINLIQDILISSIAAQHGVFMEKDTAEQQYCNDKLNLYLDGFVSKLIDSESKDIIAQQEGNAVLKLIIEDGFSPAVVAKAFTSNERMQNIHKDNIHNYIESVLSQCQNIKSVYDDIKSFSVSRIENFAQIYKKFAKERVDIIGEKLLTVHDDQVIAENVYKFLEKHYESVLKKRNPEDSENVIQEKMKAASHEIFKNIEGFIKNNSPVANEPGRSASQYAKSVVLSVQHQNNHPSFTVSLNDVSKVIYNNKIRMMLARLRRSSGDMDSKNHIISVLSEVERKGCLDALRSGATAEIIEKAIFSVHERENLSLDNISNIINSAQNAYELEKKIINYNTVMYEENNDEKKYEDMYRYSIRRKISNYPSKIIKITESETDDEALEFILNINPEICSSPREKGLLCRAISECSPGAQLVSSREEYAQAHVDKAVRNFRNFMESQSSNILFNEYNEMKIVEEAGVAGTSVSLKNYNDGRVVLKMLQNKMDEKRIHEVVSLVADISNKPDNYVDKLIEHGNEVCRRYDLIRSSDDESDSLESKYYSFMKYELSTKNFIRSQADVEFLKEIILDYDYDKETISKVIRENSPLAAEYGRNEDYSDFIVKSAEMAVKDYQESQLRSIIDKVGFKSGINGDLRKTIKENFDEYNSLLKENRIKNSVDTDRVYLSMLLKTKNTYPGIVNELFNDRGYDSNEMAKPVIDMSKKIKDVMKSYERENLGDGFVRERIPNNSGTDA